MNRLPSLLPAGAFDKEESPIASVSDYFSSYFGGWVEGLLHGQWKGIKDKDAAAVVV